MRASGLAALRSLPWALVESAGLAGFMFITAALLARLIGPTQFGLASLALGIVQLLNLAVEALFHDAIVQREELKQSHVDTAMWSSMLLGGTLAVVVWISAPYVAAVFDARQVGTLTAWASLAL